MNLRDAINALYDGKKIRATHWNADSYVHMKDGDIYTQIGTKCLGTLSIKSEYELWEEPKPKLKRSQAIIQIDDTSLPQLTSTLFKNEQEIKEKYVRTVIILQFPAGLTIEVDE